MAVSVAGTCSPRTSRARSGIAAIVWTSRRLTRTRQGVAGRRHGCRARGDDARRLGRRRAAGGAAKFLGPATSSPARSPTRLEARTVQDGPDWAASPANNRSSTGVRGASCPAARATRRASRRLARRPSLLACWPSWCLAAPRLPGRPLARSQPVRARRRPGATPVSTRRQSLRPALAPSADAAKSSLVAASSLPLTSAKSHGGRHTGKGDQGSRRVGDTLQPVPGAGPTREQR